MRIRLHKYGHDRHRLEVLRDDGTRSEVDLETKSLLAHDLMHWVCERRAGLADGVFGRIERGAEPTALQAQAPAGDDYGELHAVESVVGLLQGAAKRDLPAQALVDHARSYLPQVGGGCPDWFDAALVTAVLGEHRALMAQWRGLRLGGVLELTGTFAGAGH
ncbi:MAG: hypothetical protein AB7O97_05745 [Planctomycetota bacterium]